MSGSKQESWRIWLVAVLVGCWATGCKSPELPADPLFISRKPIEAKPETAAPVALAYVEPPLPPEPFLMPRFGDRPQIAQPSATTANDDRQRKVPGILTNRSGQTTDGPELQVIPPAFPDKPH
jgi:hypothetical protein